MNSTNNSPYDDEDMLEDPMYNSIPPFGPADDVVESIPDTRQSLDSDIDKQELYDEGRSGAAEVEDSSFIYKDNVIDI